MHKQKPLILTILILTAIVIILITGPQIMINIPFMLMQIFGFLLIGWAFLAQQVNKRYHHHFSSKDMYFVTKGPYEIIRHPIYAGILFIMAGYVQGYVSVPRFLTFGLLLLFVVIKILNDENRMTDEVKEYKEYKKRTHKLIPYFY